MTKDPQKPIKVFRVGNVEAAVWRNEVVQNGKATVQHSIKIQRRYQDKTSGDWKATAYYYRPDLPDLVFAAHEAFTFIRRAESGDNDSEPRPTESD